jgi:hypothetical protein
MCIIIFSMAACSCPPVPAHPYLRLCPTAKKQDPVRACPQGKRRSETLRYQGPCLWCRQCGREQERCERRGRTRSVLAREGKEGARRAEGRDMIEGERIGGGDGEW